MLCGTVAKKNTPDNPNETAKSIRMRNDVWEILDRDADRCGRSQNRQIESILKTYYGIESVDIDRARIEETRRKQDLSIGKP
jgi:hypothetical protein